MVGRQFASQEAFDEAVALNIEELGLEEDEAIDAATEELALQGLDLSKIQTQGKSVKNEHPLGKLLEHLKLELSSGKDSRIQDAAQSVKNELAEVKDADLAAAMAVAAEANTACMLVEALRSRSGDAVSELLLQTLRAVLSNDQSRAQFASSNGCTVLLQLLQDCIDADALVQAVAEVAEAAATACEDNKTSFVHAGIGKTFVDLLSSRPSVGSVQAMSRAVKKLTTADDKRTVVSRAFQNSRTLATQGLHLAFLSALKQSKATSPEHAAACCSAIKKLAVNEELCCQLADAGGVRAAMQVIDQHHNSSQASAAACSMLRQMACSDSIKSQILAAEGLQAAGLVISAHSSNVAALEQALGLIAAVTLRSAEAAAAAMQAGLADAVLDVMNRVKQQWVQRQACMSMRNFVARNVDARPVLLEKGAEEALKQAKQDFPSTCQDVGSAALRDLGLENYTA